MNIFRKKRIQPGNRIKVLVVDDSVVIRRLICQALEQDPALEVVGSAPNGSIALSRVGQLNPDVITLDIEMPEMDGLEMLRQLRKTHKDTRVIMCSTLTERGGAATMEALSSGADDYVTKPSSGSLDRSSQALQAELISKIKQFFSFDGEQIPAPPVPRVVSHRPLSVAPAVVAIGVSTGGPTALRDLVSQFPADFALPILIVQHMPPLFTRLLAERLQTDTKLKVEEASEGSTVEPGKILIAPGNYHLRARKNGRNAVATLDQGPPECSCRPSVDVLFRSVQEVWGGAAIAVILTGMGSDGLRGTEVLKAAGAYVIAQDEATSVVWGMPGAVVQAGLADAVLPLDRIVPEILLRSVRTIKRVNGLTTVPRAEVFNHAV